MQNKLRVTVSCCADRLGRILRIVRLMIRSALYVASSLALGMSGKQESRDSDRRIQD
jgi:hypothetical protein